MDPDHDDRKYDDGNGNGNDQQLSEGCEDEWKGYGLTQKMRGGDAFVQEIHLKSFCPRR